jgi:hypothetical protein
MSFNGRLEKVSVVHSDRTNRSYLNPYLRKRKGSIMLEDGGTVCCDNMSLKSQVSFL